MAGLLSDRFDPNVRRQTLLPYPQGALSGQKGPVDWSNWVAPQFFVDAIKRMELPGRAWRGENIPARDITKMAMDTMGGGGLLSRAVPTGDVGGLLGINVFHGGPRKWAPEPGYPQGRPRMDKMGTGEGGQAFGHGFYSAEAPDVAKNYKDLATGKNVSSQSQGTLYKLDIPDADAAKYLDYDAPIKNQPKELRDALFGALEDLQGFKQLIPAEKSTLTGQQLYQKIVDAAESAISSHPDAWLPSAKRALQEEAATEALRKAGIPGLKYFDQGSRGTRQGTRNYVTWDQDVLDRTKILERDGKLTSATIETTKRGDVLEITKIGTPKDLRGGGLADQELNDLIFQADLDGTTLALTPSNAFGANKAKLEKWYRRHGFVPNKGKNKNFTTKETMIRLPRPAA